MPDTVRAVVQEEQLPAAAVPKRRHRRKPRVRRFERARPNALWQSDITSLWLARPARRVYLTVFLDDHSRYVVGFHLARRRLDGCRLRATLGYRTAIDVDETLPRVEDPCARARIAREARRAMDEAVQGRHTLRAQRQSQRAAVLNLLQEKNLITRTRGDGSPVTLVPDIIS